jgi:hypothetical protein
MKNHCLMASCVLLVSASAAMADEAKITRYQNPKGSELALTWHPDNATSGTLTGTFKTAVSQCKAAIGQPMPVTGVYNGNVLALTINYPACESVLAFSGNTDKDHSNVNLHWFLTKHAENLGESWDATTTGVDIFRSVSK